MYAFVIKFEKYIFLTIFADQVLLCRVAEFKNSLRLIKYTMYKVTVKKKKRKNCHGSYLNVVVFFPEKKTALYKKQRIHFVFFYPFVESPGKKIHYGEKLFTGNV